MSGLQLTFTDKDNPSRPEDELIPACREAGVAVIARVPFDEGSLTGAIRDGSAVHQSGNHFCPAHCQSAFSDQTEAAVLDELNLARTNPAAYARHIEQYKRDFKNFTF